MPARALQFLQRWLITTLAVLVAANVVNGIRYDSLTALLVASLLLGFLTAFARPLLLVLSLPLLVFSLGLFILVINALLLWFVGSLVRGFHVAGFWPAFWGALVISVVSTVAGLFLGTGPHMKVKTRTGSPRDRDGGGGPVIDV